MDYNQFILRQNRLSRKQFSEFQQLSERRGLRVDNTHRFSEPKTRINLIKINKNKLPGDFFIKKETHHRRNINNKQHPTTEPLQPFHQFKKAESERLYDSPEKTSFYGFMEEEQQQSLKINGGLKLYSRKFETRDEPKRDAFPLDSARKLTTATKNGKNQLLELFPSTYDEQLADIIVLSSKSKNLKISPRKQLTSRLKETQPMIDPQKQTLEQSDKDVSRQGFSLKVTSVGFELPKQAQSMNITFFNSKSTSFPPINRPANQ